MFWIYLINTYKIFFIIQVKDMSHENVISLIGVCIGPTETYILTQYCAKGSLEVIY